MILQLIGWFACIAGKVVHDHYRWGKINHTAGTIVMIVIGVIYEWFVFNAFSNGLVWFQDVTIFMVTSYWIFMEGPLHLSKGLNWFYQGTTARLDRFFRKNMPLYLGLKIFAAVLLIYSFVQIVGK